MKSMVLEIARQGFGHVPHFLDKSECQRLREHWQKVQSKAVPARISKDRVLNERIRGDSILWLDEAGLDGDDPLFARLHQLRKIAAEELLLSLHDFEAHFASYPPGAAYSAHFDQPRAQGRLESRRLLSLVIYLNSNWQPGDGGELVLWKDQKKSAEWARIEPREGTAVLFRSDTIFHEVLKANQPRLSIAVWFRRE